MLQVERPFLMFLLCFFSFFHNISIFLHTVLTRKSLFQILMLLMLPIRIAMFLICNICLVYVCGSLSLHDVEIQKKRKKLLSKSLSHEALEDPKVSWENASPELPLSSPHTRTFIGNLKVILYLLFTIQIAWNLFFLPSALKRLAESSFSWLRNVRNWKNHQTTNPYTA